MPELPWPFRRRPPAATPVATAGAPGLLPGGHQDATVLFADLEGFTGLAERLPPQAVVALLNEYYAAMAEVLDRHQGRLDQVMGDGMLVVWELAPPEGPRRAARAALAMQGALAKLQARWLAEGKLPLKARMGLASGRVVVGMIGPPGRQVRTVVGDAVNTAARLEALNKLHHTDIIAAESTYAHLGALVHARPLGPTVLRGRSEPIALYALTGWRDGTSEFGP